MFYEGLRLWGAHILTKLRGRVGPLKKDLTCVGGSELGSFDECIEDSGSGRLDLLCFTRV